MCLQQLLRSARRWFVIAAFVSFAAAVNAQSISVTSPNGGDYWFAGDTTTVTWTSTGQVGNVSIDVSTDGGASFRALAYNVTNSGSATITVPFWPSANCLVRVQAVSGSAVDSSDSLFTIKTNSTDGTTHLELLWSIAPGSVPYVSSEASGNERGLAYNGVSNELVVVHHGSDGLSVTVLDADTGAFKRALNTAGINGGDFLLDRVGVTGDGVIYVANVENSVSPSNPFKVYRWSNSDGNITPTVAYSGTAGFANGLRVGDSFTLRGAGKNTQILLGANGDSTASMLTTTDGTNFTAALLTTDAPSNTFASCVAFASTNSFWGKAAGLPLTKMVYNKTNLTATTSATITTLPNFGTFGIDPVNNLMAAIVPGNGPDQFDLYSITNPSNPTLLDSWTFANTNANVQMVGTVVFARNRLFSLDSGGGLQAFSLLARRVADLRFDLTGFCCGCSSDFCTDQFNDLNFVSANGHYEEQTSYNHLSLIAGTGNSIAVYYNSFNNGDFPSLTGAQKAAVVDNYVTQQFGTTKPSWIILNEISGGTWPTNSSYRQYVRDAVHALKYTYGYTVIIYAPFSVPGNNGSDWQAVAADAYIAVENYLSGEEIKNNGFSVSWCQSQYQSSIDHYGNLGVPKSRLMLGEYFSQSTSGTGWGRAGVSASDWIQAINVRSQAAINCGYPGFLGYAWGGDTNVVPLSDLISFEDAYASNNLPGPNPWVNPPVISKQPTSQTVAPGTDLFFTVKLSGGTAPLIFQWYRNGVVLSDGGNISGTQSDSLTMTGLQGPETGSYTVVITNTFGTVTSTTATLTISGPVIINPQPASQTNVYGANVVFSVIAAGTSPISYSWNKTGVALSNGGNISGADTPILSLNAVTGTDSGTYSLTASNALGPVTSSNAVLVVLDPGIIAQPQSQTLAIGSNLVFQVLAAGTPILSYRWQKGGVNLNDGGTVAGSTSPNLTLSTIAVSDQGSYDVVVNNSSDTITSQSATLTIADPPPVITSQPKSLTQTPGALATFTVVATGTNLSYQWYKNFVPLTDTGNGIPSGQVSGSLTPTLSVANCISSNAGSYTVTVSNPYGSAPSALAILTMVDPFPFYEPFNYPAGSILVGQTNIFAPRWDDVGTSTGGPDIGVASGNLSNANLPTSQGDSIEFGGLANSARWTFPVKLISGQLFYSYLFKVIDLTGTSASGVWVAGFNNTQGTQTGQPTVVATRLYLRATTGGYNIGTSKGSATVVWDPRVFTTNDTVFLVGSYTFVPGSNADISQMWINPNPTNFASASAPPADLVVSSDSNINGGQIYSFVYLQRAANEPAAMIADELRIGTNWAQVTPLFTDSAPTLSVAIIDFQTVQLSWPTNVTGYNLQSAGQLLATGTPWSNVAGSPSVIGLQFVLTNTLSGTNYYRLSK